MCANVPRFVSSAITVISWDFLYSMVALRMHRHANRGMLAHHFGWYEAQCGALTAVPIKPALSSEDPRGSITNEFSSAESSGRSNVGALIYQHVIDQEPPRQPGVTKTPVSKDRWSSTAKHGEWNAR